MSTRAALLGVLAGLLVTAPTASAMDAGHHDDPVGGAAVSIGFAAFGPAAVAVVPGERVSWTNDSVRAHDVVGDDGGFDSARMPAGATFTRRFDAPGTVAYHCSLHPSMTGTVVVSQLLLAAPAAAVGPGRPFALHGRTGLPAGTAVTLAAQAADGSPERPDATATVGPDGSFAAEVTPTTTTTYRAVAGADASPPVTLLVLDRHVLGRVRRSARRARVVATVRPAAAGATVVLQAFSREHFGWYPLRRGRLDRASRVRFTVPLRRRLPLRVVLTLPDGATVLASSGPLPTGRARQAATVGA
jgi:plastocyanin